MLEKEQSIVVFTHPQQDRKRYYSLRNNLLPSLKKNDLELNFYSSLEPKIMNKLSDLSQVYIVCSKTDLCEVIDGVSNFSQRTV